MKNHSEIVYLDHQATTPTDSRVLAAMEPFFKDFFHNPHTDNYRYAVQAREAVETARLRIAQSIGARQASSIIFTGSATEANNLAIRGVAAAAKRGRTIPNTCLLYTSPSPRDRTRSRMPSSA